MEEYTMNERILMKLAEAEKKQNIKQKLKDNAWTIGLSPIAPSVGFAIDQQRRNIKKVKATGEKPKSLIERYPGTVSGAVAGGLINPLARMVGRSIAGARTSPAQLKSEMVRGATKGALGGLLFVDPLTQWGASKYYQRRDEEIERAIRNRIQEGSLQKEAAYGDFVRNLGRNYERKVGREYLDAFKKFQKATGKVDRASFEEVNKLLAKRLARAHTVGRAAHKYAPAITTGGIGLGAAGAVAGGIAAARAIKNKRQGQEKTASYYAARELLGLQKEAAYGDTIKNLASRIGSGARNTFQKLRNTPYGDTIKNLASRVESGARNTFQGLRNTPGVIKPQNLARGAIQFAQRNAKALTAGGIGLGAAGAIAGGIAAARAIKNKRQGQEKTASYYAVRELLGL
jgi:uncharacterized protein YcfJ